MNAIAAPYRPNRPLRGCRCAPPAQMHGLGLSLISKLVKASTPGPNEFKLQSTPKEIKSAIAVAGPALSVLGPWGKVAAAGAAVITAADQRAKQQRLKQAAQSGANANDLLAAYADIAGLIPGREIGLALLQQLIDAVGKTGGWPNVKKWNTISATDIFTGCKGCTPPTIPEFVRAQISGGNTNPLAMVSPWDAHVNQNWGSKWFVSTAGGLQKQLITDVFDYEVSQLAPSAPIVYGQAAADAPVAVAPVYSTAPPTSSTYTPTAPAVTSIPGIPPGVTLTPFGTLQNGYAIVKGSNGQYYQQIPGGYMLYTGPLPGAAPAQSVTTPVTLPAVGTTPAVTVNAPATVPPDNTSALIAQLMSQGASQQQAFAAAMQSLASQGVPPTPQVQQQVANDVAAAANPQQASTLYLALAAAGVIGVGILMSRRRSVRRR